jgi:hypothetical protein
MWNLEGGFESLWSFLLCTRHILWMNKPIACIYFTRIVPTQDDLHYTSIKHLNNASSTGLPRVNYSGVKIFPHLDLRVEDL